MYAHCVSTFRINLADATPPSVVSRRLKQFAGTAARDLAGLQSPRRHGKQDRRNSNTIWERTDSALRISMPPMPSSGACCCYSTCSVSFAGPAAYRSTKSQAHSDPWVPRRAVILEDVERRLGPFVEPDDFRSPLPFRRGRLASATCSSASAARWWNGKPSETQMLS
jgi:hypothetical protein